MAKEMSEKKEKKSKRSSHAAELVQDAGVTKKSKKHKKSHVSDADTTMLSEAAVEAQTTVALARADGSDDEDGAADITMAGSDEVAVPLVSVLVPFANPLASDDKTKKKVLKGVKRGERNRLNFTTCAYTLIKLPSRKSQGAQTWRQGSRQISSQDHYRLLLWNSFACRSRGRHFTLRCHLAPAGVVRGARCSLLLRSKPCGAGYGGRYQATDERRHD